MLLYRNFRLNTTYLDIFQRASNVIFTDHVLIIDSPNPRDNDFQQQEHIQLIRNKIRRTEDGPIISYDDKKKISLKRLKIITKKR